VSTFDYDYYNTAGALLEPGHPPFRDPTRGPSPSPAGMQQGVFTTTLATFTMLSSVVYLRAQQKNVSHAPFDNVPN
jgi:hypothetical protein